MDQAQPPSKTRGYAAALLLAVAMLFLLPYCNRYSTGTYQEYVGTLVSQGISDTGGSGLTGRTARWATVDLPDGRRVSAGIQTGLFLAHGAKVKVREFKMNVGAPMFGVIGVADEKSPSSKDH